MKKVPVLLLLCLFCFSVYGQNTENNIDEVYLAKDDGSGKAGESSTNFITTDIPIFCVVKLDMAQPTEVKMNLIAVNVKGVKPETTVITTSYKTTNEQNRVNFRGKPEKLWVVGTYRVDIYLDGKLAVAQEFEIQKSAVIADKTEKPKTPAKPVRKFRKN
jgi:hypothetical protein